MDSHNHIYFLVTDDGCWVDRGIVEESYYIIVGLLYGLGLGRVTVLQGDQHCGLQRQGILQKFSHSFAYHGYAFWW